MCVCVCEAAATATPVNNMIITLVWFIINGILIYVLMMALLIIIMMHPLETLKPLALDPSPPCYHLNASPTRHSSSKPALEYLLYWSRYQGHFINVKPNAAQSGMLTLIGDSPRLSITCQRTPPRGCQEYINTSFERAQRLVLRLRPGPVGALNVFFFGWEGQKREREEGGLTLVQ